MGLIRFAVPSTAAVGDWPQVHRGYLTGADGRIFTTRVEWDGQFVGCRRTSHESSKFHVAWPVSGYGLPMLNTASLPEREEPYNLPVELARGKIVQIRNQAGAWELAGMTVPPEYRPIILSAQRLFARAASAQAEALTAAAIADEALAEACRAGELLASSYAQQALAGRHQKYPHLPASLGCGMGAVPTSAQGELFSAAFNAAAVPIRWTSVEQEEGTYAWETADAQVAWCEQHKLMVRGGPLIDLGPGGLPEWLSRWESDLFNLQSFVCDFVETAMGRYHGRIRWWEVAARLNTGGALTLNEETRLALVARILEVARQVDEEAQLLLRIDQPWGEYQARGQHRVSPLQIVDALLRSGVGLAGVNLEIAAGYLPSGTPNRDLLDYSRLIDQWSLLGIPLFVTLAVPSQTGTDAECATELEVDPQSARTGVSPQAQCEWIERFLPLLLAKPAVAGVYWSHFSDAERHDFPHAGLLDTQGEPKPALEQLLQYRQPSGRGSWSGGPL